MPERKIFNDDGTINFAAVDWHYPITDMTAPIQPTGRGFSMGDVYTVEIPRDPTRHATASSAAVLGQGAIIHKRLHEIRC